MEGGGEGEERGLRGLIDGGWERGGVYRMASFVHYMGWSHLYIKMNGGSTIILSRYRSISPSSSTAEFTWDRSAYFHSDC